MDICERLKAAIESRLVDLTTGQSDTWTLDLLADAMAEINTRRMEVECLKNSEALELLNLRLEIERLRGILDNIRDTDRMQAEIEYDRMAR